MQKKRILYLITRFIKGGADDHVLLTLKHLDKKKYDICLGFGDEHDLDMVKEAYNYSKVYSFPLKHFSFFSAIRCVWKMYWFMRKHKFHIVHTNSTEAGIAGRIAAKLAGIPIIIHTIHGVPFVPSRSWKLNKFLIFAERFCADFTTRLIPVGNVITEKYLKQRIGRKHKYHTIYGGIDFTRFQPKSKKTSKKPIISIISRLASGKGHDVFLKAAKTILKKRDAEFWIVGDGEYKNEINKMIQKQGLENNVKMLGHRKDIPNILGKTSIMALPSLAEGIPRIIMEALRMKVSVIATPVGGVPEILDHGKAGILIPTNNPDILAEKINYLLDNPKKADQIKEAGFKISEKFSIQQMIKQLEALYDYELKRKRKK